MKSYALAPMGSLFWLIFLAAGVVELVRNGAYASEDLDQGLLVLLLVPLAMIVGTGFLGYRSARGRAPARVIVASTLVAAFGLLLCLSALGRGV